MCGVLEDCKQHSTAAVCKRTYLTMAPLLCDRLCFRQAQRALRDGDQALGIPPFHAAFSISQSLAAVTGAAPRPLRIFDSIIVTSISAPVLCGSVQFFAIDGPL